ncbi:hypothetical protein BR93DRAFT_763068 [Coniochaeta sp. PMI_546]|nr:hypothetical protein BR93DRAFT_763068 [Coniochaeta sp. PMI_546]
MQLVKSDIAFSTRIVRVWLVGIGILTFYEYFIGKELLDYLGLGLMSGRSRIEVHLIHWAIYPSCGKASCQSQGCATTSHCSSLCTSSLSNKPYC